MLEIKGNDFYLDGKEYRIYSGCIHYFRVPHQYWEDRLQKLKAAGFNTVETYVAWNLHEKEKGKFDFSGMLDIEKFLRIAQDIGLNAIVRPGPYICAEWDFGGFPAWLLKDKNIRLRCNDAAYMAHVRDWFEVLFKKLAPMQKTRGGNIIAMQIENEYGSYGNDKEYLAALKKLMKECGTEVFTFTADGNWCNMISGGRLDDEYIALTFGSNAASAFHSLKGLQDEGPHTCMEFWDGWFDHWGERHHVRPAKQVAKEVETFLNNGNSFNLYMFHGGTNFNFWAGSNFDKGIHPTTTSYDYNAPLSEWGGYTPLYHLIRKNMLAYQGLREEDLPLPPAPVFQNIGKVELTEKAGLKANVTRIGQKHHCAHMPSMEELGQNFGYMVYHTTFSGKYVPQLLHLDDVHDRAYVYVNGKHFKTVWRNKKKSIFKGGNQNRHSFLLTDCKNGATIDILLDAMGRVNYGKELYDRKGIGGVSFGAQNLFGWDVYTLEMDNLEKLQYDGAEQAPCFLRGKFTAKKGDCFVHMDGFTKGFVTVNGFNLGRYWKIGPQKALYLPGTILKENEENEIIVFEQEEYRSPSIVINDVPDLG